MNMPIIVVAGTMALIADVTGAAHYTMTMGWGFGATWFIGVTGVLIWAGRKVKLMAKGRT
jgi:hypothetical protein